MLGPVVEVRRWAYFSSHWVSEILGMNNIEAMNNNCSHISELPNQTDSPTAVLEFLRQGSHLLSESGPFWDKGMKKILAISFFLSVFLSLHSQVSDSSFPAILNNTPVPCLQVTEPFHNTGSRVISICPSLCPSFAHGGLHSFSCHCLPLRTCGSGTSFPCTNSSLSLATSYV